jgi:hypothetical protein
MAASNLFAANGLFDGRPTQIRRSQEILYAGSTTEGQQ